MEDTRKKKFEIPILSIVLLIFLILVESISPKYLITIQVTTFLKYFAHPILIKSPIAHEYSVSNQEKLEIMIFQFAVINFAQLLVSSSIRYIKLYVLLDETGLIILLPNLIHFLFSAILIAITE